MRYLTISLMAAAFALAGCQFTFQDILDHGRNGPPDVECFGAGCEGDHDSAPAVAEPEPEPEPEPGDDGDKDKGHGNDDDRHDEDNRGRS